MVFPGMVARIGFVTDMYSALICYAFRPMGLSRVGGAIGLG